MFRLGGYKCIVSIDDSTLHRRLHLTIVFTHPILQKERKRKNVCAPFRRPCTQVGVGTSRLQEEMVRLGGYKSIVSIDYSPVAIELLRELHKGMPQLSYEVADCRWACMGHRASLGSGTPL